MVSSGKITILHVRSRFQGDYPLFNQIIFGLSKGYRHIVCYLSGPEQSENDTLCKHGFDVRWLPFENSDLKKFKYQVVGHLDAIIKKEKVDIIHAHRHKPTVYATLAAMKNKGVRMFSSIHGMNRTRTFSRRILNMILWWRVDKLIAVSHAVKDDILATNFNVPDEKIAVVHNGIDVNQFANLQVERQDAREFFSLPSDCFLWGSMGRLVPTKGYDILLRAWAGKKIGENGAVLVLAGAGREEGALRHLAEKLGISSEIRFLGHVTDVPKLLKALNSYVMPSRREGFGLALLEAIAAGLPVVASNVGGMPEILDPLCDKQMSYLVPAEDEKELGAAMLQLMSWPQNFLQEAATAISRRSLVFDAKKMISCMDQLYQGCVA